MQVSDSGKPGSQLVRRLTLFDAVMVVVSGALAAMAIRCAIFLGRAFPALGADQVIVSHALFGAQWRLTGGTLIAVGTVIVLTAVNLRSVKIAALLQNTTALAFLAAIVGIAVLGPVFGRGSWSHLGAASVVTLGGARIYYSMARDGVFFDAMRRVHPRWRTPAVSLVAQGVWASVLIVSGRYEQLYTCFIFMMTLSYVLTVGAVFVLRRTQPNRLRPYRCAGYPWLPFLYLVIALAFVVSTLLARPLESLAGLGFATLGVPLYFYWHRARPAIVSPT